MTYYLFIQGIHECSFSADPSEAVSTFRTIVREEYTEGADDFVVYTLARSRDKAAVTMSTEIDGVSYAAELINWSNSVYC